MRRERQSRATELGDRAIAASQSKEGARAVNRLIKELKDG